ncbi:MAG: hypothetical protein ABL925_20315 [Methylococcales bacterium]
MQITAELDNQHMEKLQALEKTLKKTQSELIAFAIDEIFAKTPIKSEGQTAFELMQQSGFIGSLEDNGNLSENYKNYLGHGRILSTDKRDFHAYRWKNTQPFSNLLCL